MSRLLLALLLAAACKGKDEPKPPPTPPVAKAVPADAAVAAPDAWETCKTALAAAARTPATKRAMSIIEACKPCGDWTPLLTWNVSAQDGGPTRKAIEATMIACKAYCDPNAKQRFLGALDDARAKDTRIPWRELGEFCKGDVSALPDARFMSAPLFALDRIARDVGARADGASLLAGIEIPLPAVSITGAGMKLPESPMTKPEPLSSQITVNASEIRIGPLPRGTLTPTGVAVTGADYPGTVVTTKALAAALDKLTGPIGVFAPEKMPAARVAEVAAAAGKHTLHLAVTSTGGPPGWAMYGTVPIALGSKVDKAGVTLTLHAVADEAIKAAKATPIDALKKAPVTIKLDKTATVASLAMLLGALAFFEVPAVTLVPPAKS